MGFRQAMGNGDLSLCITDLESLEPCYPMQQHKITGLLDFLEEA